jgi:DNA sulfur modification protein DndB
MPHVTVPCIAVVQHGRSFLITKLQAGLLTRITYASIRGHDNETGAVQRYLSTRRISAIKEFTLSGGNYPSAIVLNWVNTEHPLQVEDSTLTEPDIDHSAQLIDGQHRVAGLKAALDEDPDFALLEIPTAIYQGLNTRDCADIFLAINTEQKPVPRSLVFDLYGIASEQMVDPAVVRARDIVMALNEEEGSPYFDLIKLPGSPRRKGGIALSTAVTAIKPMVEEKGDFDQISITALQGQLQLFTNYFGALAKKYQDQWDDRNNAFMYAAGFVGAVEFLRLKLIPYGLGHRSFTEKTFLDALDFAQENLILQEEVKGVGGKDAPKRIFERLNGIFVPVAHGEQAIEL